MKQDLKKTPTYWIARHSLFMWLGIIGNAFLFVPLFFWPDGVIEFFNVPPLESTIWARTGAMLLAIISVFYIPAAIDVTRYRWIAWIEVFPSRTFGATFFAAAVFLYGQAPGFLIVSILDATFGFLTLYCLIKLEAAEKAQAASGGTP